MNFLKGLFGSGVVGSLERVASEFIQTDMETAEAKSLFIKTLDPNGMMRRELSRFACRAYGFYLVATTILIFIHAFGDDPSKAAEDAAIIVSQSGEAVKAMTNLFLPITTAWGSIVTASFGVNFANVQKGR
jgi:hypothetical protein